MPATKAYHILETWTREEIDEGIEGIAVAGDGTEEVEVVNWSNPSATRIVRFIAACQGDKPTVPKAVAESSIVRLKKSWIEAPIAYPGTGGKRSFMVKGEYTYIVLKRRKVNDALPLGAFSADADGIGLAQVLPADVFQDLMTWLKG